MSRQPLRGSGRLLLPTGAAVVTVAAASGVVLAAVRHRGEDFSWAADGDTFLLDPVAVGLVCGLAGAFAWAVHRLSCVGPLLTASGLLWLAQLAPLASGDVWLTIGALTLGAYSAPLVHLALAFPDGVRRGRLDRGVLVAVYGFAVVHGLVNAMFAPTIEGRSTLLQVGDGSMAVIEQAGILYLVPLAADVVVVVLVVRRWSRATPATRRGTGAVVVAVALTLGYLSTSIISPYDDDAVSAVVLMIIPVALVAALAWSRSRRVAVDDLVVGLTDHAATDLEALRSVLARALRDPGLVVVLGGREGDGRLDVAELGRQRPDRQVLPLVRRGRTVGALVHDPSVADEPRRLEAVAAAAALVLDNGLLVEDLAAQLEQVSASRARIVAAGDEQRRRLEHDLHDGAQQRLVSAALLLTMASAELEDGTGTSANAEARSFLADARDELSGALVELRELAHGLAPATLTEHGLEAALEVLLDRFGPRTTLVARLPHRLERAVEAAAYYLVAEAVTNAVKHACATVISVEVALQGVELVVIVSDDGIGGADPDGFGLVSMSDRAAALGGRFSLCSEPGQGTRIVSSVPARAHV